MYSNYLTVLITLKKKIMAPVFFPLSTTEKEMVQTICDTNENSRNCLRIIRYIYNTSYNWKLSGLHFDKERCTCHFVYKMFFYMYFDIVCNMLVTNLYKLSLFRNTGSVSSCMQLFKNFAITEFVYFALFIFLPAFYIFMFVIYLNKCCVVYLRSRSCMHQVSLK